MQHPDSDAEFDRAVAQVYDAEAFMARHFAVEDAEVTSEAAATGQAAVTLAIYYPRYEITSELTAERAAWLAMSQGDGPLELIDVTDVCASCGVRATLYDAQGNIVGYVDSVGDYRLV